MKKTIKRVLQYRIEGVESVIQIDKINIKFKQKSVLSTALSRCKNDMEQLMILENELQSKIRLKDDEYSTKICESEKRISNLTNDLEQVQQKKIVLEALLESKSSYIEENWCTGWIAYWKLFFRENHKDIDKKIQIIKQDVDEESREIIDLLLNRNINILPVQEYTDFFLYNKDKIYTKWELDGMKAGLPEKEIREKYHIKPNVYLETPVFNFHCGLSLLPHEIKERIRGKDIIDGGAFWGDSALVLQEYFPRSIHAFEPVPTNFINLCETKEKNNLENLYPIQAGLGETTSNKKIYYHEMLSGASIVSYKAIANEKSEIHENDILVTTIDEYVLKNELDIGLIKLDVEGSELESIKGAVTTISKYKPILLIAVYHLPKDLFEIKPFIENLDLGYRFMFRKLVFHDPLTEVSLIGYVP